VGGYIPPIFWSLVGFASSRPADPFGKPVREVWPIRDCCYTPTKVSDLNHNKKLQQLAPTICSHNFLPQFAPTVFETIAA
jgi:hypothetical protein